MPYKIDRIMEIAVHYGIAVVEDSAEALGSSFNRRSLGTFGKFGVLSFYGSKDNVSESIFSTGLCLPSGQRVSDDDVRYICDIIHAVF